jgi:chaperonin GroES
MPVPYLLSGPAQPVRVAGKLAIVNLAKPTRRKARKMAKIKVRPLGEKVLVKRVESEEKTAGGIVLPDTAKEKPQRATVLAVGDGKLLDSGKRMPLTVKKNDQVLLSKWGGTEINVDREEYLILDEADILAIVQ